MCGAADPGPCLASHHQLLYPCAPRRIAKAKRRYLGAVGQPEGTSIVSTRSGVYVGVPGDDRDQVFRGRLHRGLRQLRPGWPHSTQDNKRSLNKDRLY